MSTRPKRIAAAAMSYVDSDIEINDSDDSEEVCLEVSSDVVDSSKNKKGNNKSNEGNSQPKNTKKQKRNEKKDVRKSIRSTNSTKYVEASSDDEFAKENFILPDSDGDDAVNTSSKRKRNKQNDSDNDDEDDDDDFDYHVQFILGRKSLPASEWRTICGSMETREVNRGSVLKQPDVEFFDTSSLPVEKFLIKWTHSSFLHVTWETEKDLVDLVGLLVRGQIKKFIIREGKRQEIFEDLRVGEYFPVSFIQIDRILAVEDDDINPSTVNWKDALAPYGDHPIDSILTVENNVSENMQINEILHEESDGEMEVIETNDDESITDLLVDTDDDDDEATEICKRKKERSIEPSRKVGKGTKNNLILHGSNCWLTIKWEGQQYSEMSIEHIEDLIRCKVDYEHALRSFYRREQISPIKGGSKKIKRSLDKGIMETIKPPPFAGGELRDYQWDGVRWLLFNWSQKRNSILADEMGLGKTIQSATLLQMLKSHQGLRGPFLIVVPLSTLINWQREILTWTDLDVIVYHGSNEDRELIREYEFSYMNKKVGHKIEVVVTTPEVCVLSDTVTRTRNELTKICWDVIIIDEAHKLKNYESKFSTAVRDDFDYRNCVLLTGTPLQNNTDELWSLLNFVAREDFADRDSFVREFGELKTSAQLDSLHCRLKPYLLRREKDNVEKTVPPKEEIVVEVELTIPQKQYYRAIYEMKAGFLYKGERGAKDGPSLSNLAMELRKCCNHPFLIKGAEKELAKHFVNDNILDTMIKSSGKMALLDKLLPKLQSDGHRVLIFSQFRIMLDIIEDYMSARGFTFERVDGAVTGKKRQAAIDRYKDTNTGLFAMLLSTRAGGVGINLTAADTVIIYDSDWNPQNDIQAQARAHRIGQTKPVKVYRLLTRNTYETAMFRAASLKLGLDYAVMHNMKGGGLEGISSERSEHISSLSKKELENLLKHGAYDVFREGDEENTNFFEADIDQILMRSAKVLHDGNKSKVQSTGMSSGFSKASFVSSSENACENISIDDPDFWSKVVGLSVDEEREEGSKKRKCRNEFVSYKEPGMAEFMLNQGHESDDEKGRRKKKDLDPDAEIPAEWTEANLNRVLYSMLSRGYSNWEAVKLDSKLQWSLVDISRAGRYMLLQLLLQSSIRAVGNKESNEEVADSSAESKCDPAVIDIELLQANIRKSKACRLALAAIHKDPFKIEMNATCKSAGVLTQIPEYTLLNSLWSYWVKECSEESSLQFFDKSSKCQNNIVHEDYYSCTMDAATQTGVSENVITSIENLRAIGLNVTDNVDLDKSLKNKVSGRNKLSQIDDLFEFYLVIAGPIQMGIRWSQSCSLTQNIVHVEPVVLMDIAPLNIEEETVLSESDEKLVSFFMAHQSKVTNEDCDVDGDTDPSIGILPSSEYMFNSFLVEAIAQIGWPDGKRKLEKIQDFFVSKGLSIESALGIETTDLNDKILLKKAKEIALVLRGVVSKEAKREPRQKSVNHKKITTNIIKTVQRIGRPRTMYESLQSTYDFARHSHPRDLTSQSDLPRRSYLLSWETFMLECGSVDVYDLEKTKGVVSAIFETKFSTEVSDNNEKEIKEGILVGFTSKTIELCEERADIMHKLRLALTCTDEAGLIQYIQRNCKGTGPSAHPSRRDMTLPVWWTRSHDMSLLRLTEINGLGQWKSLINNSTISTALSTFEMPSRVQGLEWQMVLNAKAAEKRFLSLISAINASIPYDTLPRTLSSPEYALSKYKPVVIKGIGSLKVLGTLMFAAKQKISDPVVVLADVKSVEVASEPAQVVLADMKSVEVASEPTQVVLADVMSAVIQSAITEVRGKLSLDSPKILNVQKKSAKIEKAKVEKNKPSSFAITNFFSKISPPAQKENIPLPKE